MTFHFTGIWPRENPDNGVETFFDRRPDGVAMEIRPTPLHGNFCSLPYSPDSFMPFPTIVLTNWSFISILTTIVSLYGHYVGSGRNFILVFHRLVVVVVVVAFVDVIVVVVVVAVCSG